MMRFYEAISKIRFRWPEAPLKKVNGFKFQVKTETTGLTGVRDATARTAPRTTGTNTTTKATKTNSIITGGNPLAIIAIEGPTALNPPIPSFETDTYLDILTSVINDRPSTLILPTSPPIIIIITIIATDFLIILRILESFPKLLKRTSSQF